MGFFDLFKNKNYKVSEIEFQPSWDDRCEIMNILEQEGYDLTIRSGKRDMSIVNFKNLEELNKYLMPYNLYAEIASDMKILNPVTGELFIHIKFSSSNIKRPIIDLYKNNHISIFYKR